MVFVMIYLKRSTGSLASQAFLMKYGFIQHDIVEFYKAVFGTMALMGKDILVRLRSPEMIFLPTIFIISLPIDRILLT